MGSVRRGDGPVAGKGQSWAETKPAGFRDPLNNNTNLVSLEVKFTH